MNFFSAMEILSSGLGAQRVRMNVTAANLANAETTRTAEGGPYRRRDPVFEASPLNPDAAFGSELAGALQVVKVTDVLSDQEPPRRLYDPAHPDADANGYVAKPNVNLVEEMVNMITAARAYEAGVTAMRSVVDMARKAINLGR